MSKITEMVEDEAIQAEAEDADADAEGDAVPADEPVPDAPLDAGGLEKALATMEKENVRHAKRIAEIMGADFAFVHVCPGCVDFAAGFTLTPPDVGPTWIQAGDAQQCAACAGMGDVLTGAIAERGKLKQCNDCGGQGWTTKLTLVPQTSTPAASAPVDPGSVQQLRMLGYTIIEPFQQPHSAAGQ